MLKKNVYFNQTFLQCNKCIKLRVLQLPFQNSAETSQLAYQLSPDCDMLSPRHICVGEKYFSVQFSCV